MHYGKLRGAGGHFFTGFQNAVQIEWDPPYQCPLQLFSANAVVSIHIQAVKD